MSSGCPLCFTTTNKAKETMKSTINKILFLTAVAAATLPAFTSCSQDESIDERLSSGAIGFNMVLDHSNAQNRPTGTRAASGTTVMDATSFQNFRVWAYDANVLGTESNSISPGGAMYMGSTNAAGVLIKRSDNNTTGANGYQFGTETSGGKYWGYDQVSDVKYWPKNYLQFFAIGPNGIDNITSYAMPATYDGTNTFTYTADASDLTKHKDIIVAAKRQAGTVGNSNVALTFKHALSQVIFLGKVTPNQPNLHVRIYSVSVCNVNKTGTFTFPLETNGDLSTLAQSHWGTLSTPSTYTIQPMSSETTNYIELTANTSDVTQDGTTYSLMNGGTSDDDKAKDPLFLIPQTVSAWDYSSNYNDGTKAIVGGGTNADGQADGTQTGAYLKINCAIYQVDGVPIVGSYSASTYTGEDVYVPLSVNWNPGTKYIYTLQFGIGRNQYGVPLGAPITFSVSSVTDWTSSPQNVSL